MKMSDQQKDKPNQMKPKYAGSTIGMILGAGAGLLLGNILLGAGVGLCFGLIFDKKKK